MKVILVKGAYSPGAPPGLCAIAGITFFVHFAVTFGG